MIAKKCIQNVMSNFETQLEEEYSTRFEIETPWAEHYWRKMNKRIARILDGEQLGPMIDSEFEDL